MIRYLIIMTSLLAAQIPSVESIQDSLITRFNRIEDYSVKIKVSVKMTGLRMPRKQIKLYYKAPDKMKVKSKGFAIVPKRGLGGSPEQFLSMMKSIHVSGRESLHGRNHWLLTGSVIPDSLDIPIEKDDFLNINMNLWVDADSWVISLAETMIDSQRVFHLLSEYEEVENVFLPSKTTLSIGFKGLGNWTMRDPFGGPTGDRKDFNKVDEEAGIDPNENEFAGTVVMEFSKYKVNQGLDDSFFNK